MPVIVGNPVNYGSGGRWYVQMVVTDDGPNTSGTTGVDYRFQVVFERSISDSSNQISWQTPWGSGSRNNFPFTSAGTHEIAAGRTAATIHYGRSDLLYFRMTATGMASGGTGPSTAEYSHPTPWRSPSPPSPPPTAHDQVTATSARIVVSPSVENNGAHADIYETYVLTNNAWPDSGGNVVQAWRGGTGHVGNLLPFTEYYYTARSSNLGGWSAWTPMRSFKTLSAGYVKVGDIYQHAIPYVNVNGEWRQAVQMANHNGTWR